MDDETRQVDIRYQDLNSAHLVVCELHLCPLSSCGDVSSIGGFRLHFKLLLLTKAESRWIRRIAGLNLGLQLQVNGYISALDTATYSRRQPPRTLIKLADSDQEYSNRYTAAASMGSIGESAPVMGQYMHPLITEDTTNGDPWQRNYSAPPALKPLVPRSYPLIDIRPLLSKPEYSPLNLLKSHGFGVVKHQSTFL